MPTLAPPPPTELSQWREQFASITSGHALLEHLISPHDATELVSALPIEELHRAIYEIGMADCTELIELASGEQIRGILDHESWIGDQLDLERMDPWLNLLMRAGPDTLGPRLMNLDDEMINWIVRQSVRAVVVDEPDDFDPPDEEHVITPDGRLCIVFPFGKERDMPVKIFIDWLMRNTPIYCVDLLLHSSAALNSTLQEHAYRWRSARMADRGYVDYYEALKVYTPPSAAQLKTARHVEATELGASARWLRPVLNPKQRVGQAFAALPADVVDDVQQSLAYLVNMAMSADRIEAWDVEAQDLVMARIHAGLSLGLEMLVGEPDARRDAGVLEKNSLTVVFRAGYARILEAARPVRVRPTSTQLRRGDDPVGALGLSRLNRWAPALTTRHPTLPDGEPVTRTADLAQMANAAQSITALASFAADHRPGAVDIGPWVATALVRDLIGLDGPGPLPTDRLGDVHRALFADAQLTDTARDAAQGFWTRQGQTDTGALMVIVQTLVDELAKVAPDDLDPKFISILYIE